MAYYNSSPHIRRVVIVGGGLAGMSAAIEASKLTDVNVVLLEQESRIGGNSAKASSGLNAAPTRAQKEQGVDDSWQNLAEDTLKSGRGAADERLVNVMAKESAGFELMCFAHAIRFLENEGGLDMSVLTLLGGASHPRAHRAKFPEGVRASNVGFAIINALLKKLKSATNVEIVTSARVKSLVDHRGSVRGVRYENEEGVEQTLQASKVILATGGFSADVAPDGWLSKYAPSLMGMPTTNGAWKSAGDGLRWGEALGARLALMECVQVHPTGLVDPKSPNAPSVILAGEALRGDGGILVDAQGRRFTNELGYRDVVSEAILQHGGNFSVDGGTTPTAAYLLINNEVAAKFPEAIGFYSFKKLVTRYKDATAFSETTGVPLDALSSTFEHYSNAASGSSTDQFGRTAFGPAFSVDAELIVLIVTPSRHYTMGGLEISPAGEVLHASGAPIKGLFAAGEVTGGLHGCNRLGGNSLLECVVFGRRAGKD